VADWQIEIIVLSRWRRSSAFWPGLIAARGDSGKLAATSREMLPSRRKR
jgi:hypothetical protein